MISVQWLVICKGPVHGVWVCITEGAHAQCCECMCVCVCVHECACTSVRARVCVREFACASVREQVCVRLHAYKILSFHCLQLESLITPDGRSCLLILLLPATTYNY